MKALRQKFGIDEKFTHVEKGLPEEVIPDLAEHPQAGIVVLGTVGRTGLSAAFSAIRRNRWSIICAVTCWYSNRRPTRRRWNWTTTTTINPLLVPLIFPASRGIFLLAASQAQKGPLAAPVTVQREWLSGYPDARPDRSLLQLQR